MGRRAALLIGPALGMVAFAATAQADALEGTYTATISNGSKTETQSWTFTPCGADCVNLSIGEGALREMHPQGTTWSGAAPMHPDCVTTIDVATLSGTQGCGMMTFPVQLHRR